MRTEFTHWLNSQRDRPVAEVFHEIEQRVDALIAAEREACAKLVEEAYDYESFGLVAAAIRLRPRG